MHLGVLIMAQFESGTCYPAIPDNREYSVFPILLLDFGVFWYWSILMWLIPGYWDNCNFKRVPVVITMISLE